MRQSEGKISLLVVDVVFNGIVIDDDDRSAGHVFEYGRKLRQMDDIDGFSVIRHLRGVLILHKINETAAGKGCARNFFILKAQGNILDFIGTYLERYVQRKLSLIMHTH